MQVAVILRETTGASRSQVLLRLINGFRVGVSGTEREPATKPLLNSQLAAVINRVAAVVAILDWSQKRIR